MEKGTIIIICGLPGSGKTTLANELTKERRAILLNADEWIIGIIKSKSDIEEIDRLREPMEKMLWKLAEKLALIGTNVIIDNGFWIESQRKKCLNSARKIDVKIELHFLNANKDLIFNRLQKRNSDVPKNDFEIDMEKMERWVKIFETPAQSEKENFDYYKEYIQK